MGTRSGPSGNQVGARWEQGGSHPHGHNLVHTWFPLGPHIGPICSPLASHVVTAWSLRGSYPRPPPNRASSTLPFWPDRRLAMAFTSTVTHRCPDGSGFILDPLDGDDTIFMPSLHLVAGDPVAGDTVSYDVGPSQGVAYNVKAVVPEPCLLLQRRGHTEVFARSNPAAAAAAVTTAAELGEPMRWKQQGRACSSTAAAAGIGAAAAAPGSRKQRLNPKRRRAALIAAGRPGRTAACTSRQLDGEVHNDEDDGHVDDDDDDHDDYDEPAAAATMPSAPSAAAEKSAARPMQMPWLHSRVHLPVPLAARTAAASAKSAVRPTQSPTLTSGACSPAAPGTVKMCDLVAAAKAAGQRLMAINGIIRRVEWAQATASERAEIEAQEAAIASLY